MIDNMGLLAETLYGRKPIPQDYLGGSNANIFEDAMEFIKAQQLLLVACRLGDNKRAVRALDKLDKIKNKRRKIAQKLFGSKGPS